MKSFQYHLTVVQFALDPVEIHGDGPLLLGKQILGLKDGCAHILDRTGSTKRFGQHAVLGVIVTPVFATPGATPRGSAWKSPLDVTKEAFNTRQFRRHTDQQ